ncbi:hypothetical protein ASE07_04350 [Noviherbaspirillum sp. Root189]|nr:hypothetical protein ASE07_04350 [Noviherbaspirillum sp. Root189]
MIVQKARQTARWSALSTTALLSFLIKMNLLLFNFSWMLHQISVVCNQQMPQATGQAEEKGLNVAISRRCHGKVMPKRQ